MRKSRNGERLAYVCEDKQGGHLILASKLALLADYISELTDHPADKITLNSLYAILSVPDGCGRTGGWSKHRWRCRAVPLEQAATTYEAMRPEYEKHVVLGTKNCVQTTR